MKIITPAVRIIFVLILISFSFIGSDCNDILEGTTGACTGNEVNLIGSWKFKLNMGGIRDICIGEIVKFNANGTANLTCPDQNTITRNYTVMNNVLTYTETGIQYCITGNTNELQLTGINNNRILYYVKVISGDNNKSEKSDETISTFNNSSELTR